MVANGAGSPHSKLQPSTAGSFIAEIDVVKQKAKGEGKITFTDDSFDGDLHMTIEEREMTTKYSGKWLGACEK